MQLTPLTLPITIELCPKSKALLDLLRSQETTAPVAQPKNHLTPPAHGDYWPGQGGHYICTLPALLGVPARHLIAGTHEAEALAYGPRDDVPGATSQIDGTANTRALLATGKDHLAAKWASNYTADGHTDFFLPARLDLVMAHICAPNIFNKNGWYWSSTQGSRFGAFVQVFEYGGSSWYNKGFERRVRAFRVIPLTT
jgi:hypothetical protein